MVLTVHLCYCLSLVAVEGNMESHKESPLPTVLMMNRDFLNPIKLKVTLIMPLIEIFRRDL